MLCYVIGEEGRAGTCHHYHRCQNSIRSLLHHRLVLWTGSEHSLAVYHLLRASLAGSHLLSGHNVSHSEVRDSELGV
jgi:hypothetical protein